MEENFGPKSGLERHVQTILVAATIAILSWQLLTILDLRDRLIRFEQQMLSLQSQINQGTDDRFRGSDWRVQKERLDERFYELKGQVQKLSDRLEKLELTEDRAHRRPGN